MNWIHRLFNPHCENCLDCKSCQTLQIQLEIANQEKNRLLDCIIRMSEPPVAYSQETVSKEPIQPIMPHHIPWQMKRNMMEAEDRIKARTLKTRMEEIQDNKEIADLERSLGIDTEVNDL
jgi:hypothetical protein